MRPITVSVTGSPGNSDLVRFDDWAPGPISIQCVVTGTVNYTIQVSNDDPNSATNPIALNSMTWSSTPDTGGVAATGSVYSSLSQVPLFSRILMNSGTGTVRATYVQAGVGPY